MLKKLVLVLLNVFLFAGMAHAQQNSIEKNKADLVAGYNTCI